MSPRPFSDRNSRPGMRRATEVYSMISQDDIAFLSIETLLTAFERRELSSRDVTQLMLSRIYRYDRQVNGYITVVAESARADADRADARRAAGDRGVLLGVPIALKDLCET